MKIKIIKKTYREVMELPVPKHKKPKKISVFFRTLIKLLSVTNLRKYHIKYNEIGIEKLRLYFSGENLLTFTPLSEHAPMFDPEGLGTDTDYNGSREGAVYPMLKTFTFGINLTF